MLGTVLASCYPQPDSQTNAQISAMQAQLRQIQTQLAQLEKSQASGEWVLWLSQVDRHSFGGGYPTAQSAYPTKESCLSAASGWSLPDGKVIATDPYIIQNNSYELTYRCLPIGVKPIGKP